MPDHKHLILDHRSFIQTSLQTGHSFRKIALALDKDPTAISKEVRNRRTLTITGAVGRTPNKCNRCLLKVAESERETVFTLPADILSGKDFFCLPQECDETLARLIMSPSCEGLDSTKVYCILLVETGCEPLLSSLSLRRIETPLANNPAPKTINGTGQMKMAGSMPELFVDGEEVAPTRMNRSSTRMPITPMIPPITRKDFPRLVRFVFAASARFCSRSASNCFLAAWMSSSLKSCRQNWHIFASSGILFPQLGHFFMLVTAGAPATAALVIKSTGCPLCSAWKYAFTAGDLNLFKLAMPIDIDHSDPPIAPIISRIGTKVALVLFLGGVGQY